LNDASADLSEEHGTAQRARDAFGKAIVAAIYAVHGAFGGIVASGELLDIGQQRELIGIAQKKIAHANRRRGDLCSICCSFSRYPLQVSFTAMTQPLGNALTADGSGDRSLPFFPVQLVQLDERIECLRGQTLAGGRSAEPALCRPATPVVKKALTQDAGLLEAKFVKQFSDLFLVIVDQITAGFRVHTAESVTQRPHPTANAVARFDDGGAAAASLEVVGSG